MVETFKIHKRKLIIGGILLLLFAGVKWFGRSVAPGGLEKKSIVEEVKEKSAKVITFGQWDSKAFREILGTVQSDSEAEIKAELSGTINKVYVKVGDTVRFGQALAQYDFSGDATAINYQSALNNLKAAKLSAENSVKAAETAVNNAERELEKTKLQQGQSTNQSRVNLGAIAKSTETTFDSALDFLDRMLGATQEYRSQVVFGQTQIGATNVILKNKTKTTVQSLLREISVLRSQLTPKEDFALNLFVERRLRFAEELQLTLNEYDRLIISTIISDRFSEESRASIQQQLEALRIKVDNEITRLKSTIEGLKTTDTGVDVTILSAENRIKSAQEQFALTKAQSQAQVVSAQNQVSLAGASQSNLTIRSVISGKISDRFVNVGDQVSFGTSLFTIVNETAVKKVVAYLSQEEWLKAKGSETINIEVEGKNIVSTEKFLSPSINLQTQKVLAEFTIISKEVLVGNLAKVKIPLGSVSEESNLLPFSAVSFEPDGAEVLVLNKDNIAERRKVIVKKVVVSNIEILSGIDNADEVVEYYKRVLPGEKVITIEHN